MEQRPDDFRGAAALIERSAVVHLASAPFDAWSRAWRHSAVLDAARRASRRVARLSSADRWRLAGIATAVAGLTHLLVMTMLRPDVAPAVRFAWGSLGLAAGLVIARFAPAVDEAWTRGRRARAAGNPVDLASPALRAVPPFSVVVPVYNESALLPDALAQMVGAFDRLGAEYEILVCENGSTDDTRELTRRIAQLHTPVRADFLPTANYGLALKHGISTARHELVAIVNVDFWSVDFVRRALALLADGADLVVGSKVMPGANDARPLLRRAITRSFSRLLRLAFNFGGTDTHGMKALRRSTVSAIADACVTDRSLFDTELVLRVERAGRRIVEIPVDVREIRQPDYWSVLRRVPEATANLIRLARELGRR